MNRIRSALLAGAATGGRSQAALAALTITTPRSAAKQPDRTLRRPELQAVIALGAVAELVFDKLPKTPSRLSPPVLAGRLITAALAGLVIARRQPEGPDTEEPHTVDPQNLLPESLPPAAETVLITGIAVAAAAVSAVGGTRWRAWAARRFGTDLVGALAEDAVVVALARSGSSHARSPRSLPAGRTNERHD